MRTGRAGHDCVAGLSPDETCACVWMLIAAAAANNVIPESARAILMLSSVRECPPRVISSPCLPSTEGGHMPKGYWINLFRNVKDPQKVDAYRKLAGPVMEAAGAKFLVRGAP